MVRKEVIGLIIDTLQESPWGLTIEDIAEKTRLHRNTVSKYISLLEEAGLAIKRQIGKYTLWFIRNIYDYFESEMAERFLIAMIRYLCYSLRLDIFNVGKDVVKIILRRKTAKRENFKEIIRSKAGIIRYFTGVYIPTIVPGIKFRIPDIKFSEYNLIIEVSGKICNVDLDTRKAFCEFMRGYIWGLLEIHQISFKDIERIESNDNSCRFRITFNKPLVEIFL